MISIVVQNITVGIIVFLSAFYVIRKLYKFIKSPDEVGCSSGKCSSCSSKTEWCTPEDKI